MKNKNGFIATGLIYSFFLIFLTLFLTVITNHIKNKVSLNLVEDDIKSELNTHKTIKNFEPGDLISFVDDCSKAGNFQVDDSFVVARVVNNNSSLCNDWEEDCLILYSYKVYNNEESIMAFGVDNSKLSLDDISKDISTGYLNGTYINKIVYNFDNTNGNIYGVGENISVELHSSNACINNIFCNDYGKIVGINSDKFRSRHIKTFTDNRVMKCDIEDAMGVIYVQE